MIYTRWAVLWYQWTDHPAFMWDPPLSESTKRTWPPLLFKTRAEARRYINERWGYIHTRRDLRRPPHGWRMPRAVKVRVILEEVR